MSSGAIKARRWSRAEYEHLVEIGIFGRGERVELLGGLSWSASPREVRT